MKNTLLCLPLCVDVFLAIIKMKNEVLFQRIATGFNSQKVLVRGHYTKCFLFILQLFIVLFTICVLINDFCL